MHALISKDFLPLSFICFLLFIKIFFLFIFCFLCHFLEIRVFVCCCLFICLCCLVFSHFNIQCFFANSYLQDQEKLQDIWINCLFVLTISPNVIKMLSPFHEDIMTEFSLFPPYLNDICTLIIVHYLVTYITKI